MEEKNGPEIDRTEPLRAVDRKLAVPDAERLSHSDTIWHGTRSPVALSQKRKARTDSRHAPEVARNVQRRDDQGTRERSSGCEIPAGSGSRRTRATTVRG